MCENPIFLFFYPIYVFWLENWIATFVEVAILKDNDFISCIAYKINMQSIVKKQIQVLKHLKCEVS